MDNETGPKKVVPYITAEEDEKNPSADLVVTADGGSICDTDKTSSTADITKSWEQQQKEIQQIHDNERDRRVTFWGFLIVSGALLLCAGLAITGTVMGEENLFRDFFGIASTSVSLVLGYLFGARGKK